jgi:hypothetical protein
MDSALVSVAALLDVYIPCGCGRVLTVQEHGDPHRFPTRQISKPAEIRFSFLIPIYAQCSPSYPKAVVLSPGFRPDTLERLS